MLQLPSLEETIVSDEKEPSAEHPEIEPSSPLTTSILSLPEELLVKIAGLLSQEKQTRLICKDFLNARNGIFSLPEKEALLNEVNHFLKNEKEVLNKVKYYFNKKDEIVAKYYEIFKLLKISLDPTLLEFSHVSKLDWAFIDDVLNKLNHIIVIQQIREGHGQELYCENCFLTRIPDTLFKNEKFWNNLTLLNLNNNMLNRFPENLGRLAKLKRLEINNNKLDSLPKSLMQLTELVWLDLSHNQLSGFPEGFERMINLKHLNLNNNKFSILPNLENLIQLEQLFLAYNNLMSVAGVEHLTELESLYLSNNKLTSLPNLKGLGRLNNLIVDGNQLDCKPEARVSCVVFAINNPFVQVASVGKNKP